MLKRIFICAIAVISLMSSCRKIEFPEKPVVHFYRLSDTDLYMHVGDALTVVASDFPTDYPNEWVSMDKNIATVNPNGRITATGLGETQVVVSNPYPYQKICDTVNIHVMPDDVYTFRSAYLKMIPVKGGSFTMGKENYPLNPAREVTVDDFQLADAEVTLSLISAVLGDSKGSANAPYTASYQEWERFLKALRDITGKPFRFPTEAEWEYAARAGSDTPYSGGNDLEELGWYKGSPMTSMPPFNEGLNTISREVRSFKPNAWGFYDMSGSAAEWVSDVVGELQAKPADLDPEDLKYQEDLLYFPNAHIAKGGSIFSPASCCTIWARETLYSPQDMPSTGPFGLRIAL